MNKVSIIMPAFNASKYIAESIESVLNQTYQNWELLIIDDGSTDSTAEIAKAYAKDYPRVIYIYQKNGKQGKARNNGIARATGEFIAFLDADDLWLPHKLEIQLNKIREQNVDLIFSEGYIIFEDEHAEPSTPLGSVLGRFEGDKALSHLIEGNAIPILTVLTYKKVIETVGGFTEAEEIQNCEDYHLWLRIINAGYKAYGMHEHLALYRRHENASTANLSAQLIKEIAAVNSIQFKNSFYQFLKKRKVIQSFRDLFHTISFNKDYASIQSYLYIFKTMNSESKWIYYSLLASAKLHPRIFRSISWRLLSWQIERFKRG